MLSRETICKLALIAIIGAGVIGLLVLSRADLLVPDWCDARSTNCFDRMTERLK